MIMLEFQTYNNKWSYQILNEGLKQINFKGIFQNSSMKLFKGPTARDID